jgi:hypothetical protein
MEPLKSGGDRPCSSPKAHVGPGIQSQIGFSVNSMGAEGMKQRQSVGSRPIVRILGFEHRLYRIFAYRELIDLDAARGPRVRELCLPLA